MEEKKLYIISGCNGAGKTTASFNILPDLLNCKEFVNADEIARGLSPFQPENVSIEAGRLMLKRIDELIGSNQDFSFETTLSTKSFINTIEDAKSKGYYVTLIFFWLESIELAKDRVRKRVAEALVNLSDKYKKENELTFSMNVSREDLANIVGTATETVIRTLSDFKEEKYIEVAGGKITILNYEKLAVLKN